MSISPAALEKLVREIESQASAAQQQIDLSRSQVASKQRQLRLLKLTQDELSGVPRDTPVYEGVGKMFVLAPVSNVQEKIKLQTKVLNEEVQGLGKHLVYLETTHKNSMQHIERMLKGSS